MRKIKLGSGSTSGTMNASIRITTRTLLAAGAIGASLMGLTACETDSFFDPSVTGRWEHTPQRMPILESLDVIEQRDLGSLRPTPIRREDLIPDVREYIVGPADVVIVDIFELLVPGQSAVFQRRVDETGHIRLPQVGTVRVSGRSASQIENDIGNILEQNGILRDPTVSVELVSARGNTFSIVGPPEQSGPAFGTYEIPEPNFRLLDAIALARGVSERVKTLTIIREVPLDPRVAGEEPESPQTTGDTAPPPPTPENPADVIQDIMEGVEDPTGPAPTDTAEPTGAAPPPGVEAGLETRPGATQWVYVGGQWVRVQDEQAAPAAAGGATAPRTARPDDSEFADLVTQRLIEVPYDQLLAGDMRYNIVIRPGDIIRVPDTNAGFVYLMGQINRPGAYSVPGTNELTIKQIVASGGGLSQLAIPERVDLVRRIGPNEEATIRLNVKAIFEGTQPDIFLKPDDLLNFGTSWVATPLAIIRNGFRANYGFGFVLDRNFADDVFDTDDNDN